jgi:hypothetical protein
MELSPHPDWELITELGGPAKVAELLDYSKEGGVQRVQNWKHRGIPPAVKLARPDLFLPGMQQKPSSEPPPKVRIVGQLAQQPAAKQMLEKNAADDDLSRSIDNSSKG